MWALGITTRVSHLCSKYFLSHLPSTWCHLPSWATEIQRESSGEEFSEPRSTHYSHFHLQKGWLGSFCHTKYNPRVFWEEGIWKDRQVAIMMTTVSKIWATSPPMSRIPNPIKPWQHTQRTSAHCTVVSTPASDTVFLTLWLINQRDNMTYRLQNLVVEKGPSPW